MDLHRVSGDGEVVEQVISQQSAESEEVRPSALDFAIRQLQLHHDRHVSVQGEGGVPAAARVLEPGTPRRGAYTLKSWHLNHSIVLLDQHLFKEICN